MPVSGREEEQEAQTPHRGGWHALKRREPWTEMLSARAIDDANTAGSVTSCGCEQDENDVEWRGERCGRCRRRRRCENPVEEEDDASGDNLFRGFPEQRAKQEKRRLATFELSAQPKSDFEFPALVDIEGENFELGPPPPSGPVLCRQNAMDVTATREGKRVGLYGARTGGPGAQELRLASRVNRQLPTMFSTDLGHFGPV